MSPDELLESVSKASPQCESPAIEENNMQEEEGAEQPEVAYEEGLDRKLLQILYEFCSVRQQQTIITLAVNVDDFTVGLHDAYVQILLASIEKASVRADYPAIGSSSSKADLLMTLTTYNALTNSTERALDGLGVHLDIRRLLVSELFPRLDIALNVDPFKFEISSGLLQVGRRLHDLYELFRTGRRGETKLGKMKEVTIYNDLECPVVLLQRSYRAQRDERLDLLSNEKGHCVIDEPIFFAVKTPYSKRDHGATHSVTKVGPLRLMKSVSASQPMASVVKANTGTDEKVDVTKLATNILKLGDVSYKSQLNEFLRHNQRSLMYGTTRDVQSILESLTEQLPELEESVQLRATRVAPLLQLLKHESGWTPIGKLRPDYQNHRAYFLKDVGCKVVVEPETNPDTGDWSLYIGTAISIVNTTSVRFRILAPRRSGAVRRFAKVFKGDLLAPIAVPKDELKSAESIVVEPRSRRSLPLSWFLTPRYPCIVPIVETEGPQATLFSKLQKPFTRIHTIWRASSTEIRRRHSADVTPATSPLAHAQVFAALQRVMTKLSEQQDSSGTWRRIAFKDSILRYRRTLAWTSKKKRAHHYSHL